MIEFCGINSGYHEGAIWPKKRKWIFGVVVLMTVVFKKNNGVRWWSVTDITMAAPSLVFKSLTVSPMILRVGLEKKGEIAINFQNLVKLKFEFLSNFVNSGVWLILERHPKFCDETSAPIISERVQNFFSYQTIHTYKTTGDFYDKK